MSVFPMLVVVAEAGLLIAALILLIPIAVLWIECGVSVFSRTKPDRVSSADKPRIAVLVPAHNEATGIRPVLQGLLAQLSNDDQLVVIADNCTDETAEVARSTGATVIERQDETRRGKGYALDYGMQFLSANPPDVVILMDADCLAQPGALAQIAQQAIATNRPVQALYLMEQPADPKPKDAVSALAFLVKNQVRPTGLTQLNLPCLLTGTGMAFPWPVLQKAALASGNIVEDMQLGVDLAIDGYPAQFCGTARVTGLLPQQQHAAKSQRTRWEHGHLQTIVTQVPKLLKAALIQRRLDLLALALELSVPPLSLLVMGWIALTGLAVIAGLLGASWLPTLLLSLAGGMMIVAVLAGWFRFGRTVLPAQTLLSIPLYLLWKIPLYLAFLFKPQTEWVRTDRDAVE
ncbi:glycosyltransferase family 2 protein [Egbenema bharatensis]|uniref:glycosyltransferase family 2 protein n=1 Tax=Egbenema bharatensis TaxID=3463334 RepID=UPI003A894460